ncbi:MAG: DUF6273 domain-containing protein, partial [Bacteroidales bacterium]|nr:DUF6273 domain-containing protein [Bacteroidales bacterium]
NFKATQTRINMNGGFLYMNETEVDYVLTCNARSTFEIENVSFSISGTVWEAHKTTSGISGVSFSEDMPANGSLTKTVHKSGSAYVGVGLKANEASLEKIELTSASGCIIVDKEKADTANFASYQKGNEYLKAKKYDEAKMIFSALSKIEYSDAEKMYEEVVKIEREEKEQAAQKAAQEKENTYESACTLEAEGNYEEAMNLFLRLAEYKDSAKRVDACKDAISERDYQSAISLMSSGEHEQAILMFKALGSYRDSKEKILVCENAILEQNYNTAISLLDQGEYSTAYSLLHEMGNYKDAQILLLSHDKLIDFTIKEIDATFAVGKTITFGTYDRLPIKWHVIKRNGREALLVSEKRLFTAPYDDYDWLESPTNVYWEMSSLRNYLNNEFLQYCFTTKELNVIQTHTNANPDGKWTINGKTRTAKGGNNTDDKVFILSREEWDTTAWRPECIGDSQKQTYLWTRDVLYRNEQKNTKNKKYYEHYAATINSSSEIVACSMNLERGIAPAIWIDVYSYKGIADKVAQSAPHSGKTTITNGNTPAQYEFLKPGSNGQAVLDARIKLFELGYFSKMPTRTDYTNDMANYVKKFEKDNGLYPDGFLSPEDQEVLFGL